MKHELDRDLAALAPPEGYGSWLEYAVETFDTGAIETAHLLDDSKSDVSSLEIREAARRELRDLCASAQQISGANNEGQ